MKYTTALLQWYEQNKRSLPWRDIKDPYGIWVSEIMLQQTRAAAVIPYYTRFMEALPNVEALAACSQEPLLKLWEGLGYYQRVRNMQKCAQLLVEAHQGQFPQTKEQLQRLPGIGPYTAAAIASIAFSQPEPAVDGNVLRVMARLFENGQDVLLPATRLYWEQQLKQQELSRAGDLNQAFMDLGSLICLPENPRCGECPLRGQCLAHKNGSYALYPYRAKKKPRRRELLTVFVLRGQEGLWIVPRAKEGLLGGLYALPCEEGHLSMEQVVFWLNVHGLRPVGSLSQYRKKHIFTHIEWDMLVYSMETEGSLPAPYLPYEGKEPLPTAFKKCLAPDS